MGVGSWWKEHSRAPPHHVGMRAVFLQTHAKKRRAAIATPPDRPLSACESSRGLEQSKTLARHSFIPLLQRGSLSAAC